MSIEEKTFLVANCDFCGDDFDTTASGGFSIFESESKLIKALEAHDWMVDNTQTVCPSCDANSRM